MDWTPPRKPALRPAGFVDPCVPTLADRPPAGPAWVHEIKHDGYRLQVWRDGERVRLFTRRGFDWTGRYPWIVASALQVPASRFLVDGEAVCCDADGMADFQRLHSREHDASVFLYAFDLLMLDGADIRDEPLTDRRAKLRGLLTRPDALVFSEDLDGDAAVMFRHACRLGLEGIVSKRRAPYRSGRSKSWLKVKNPDAPGVLRFQEEG